MKLVFFIFCIGTLFISCHKTEAPVDNTMKALDIVITDTAPVHKRIQQLDSLKQRLQKSNSLLTTYNLQQQIIEKYMWFRSDSAFHYVHKNKKIALALKDTSKFQASQITQSILLSTAGLLNESSEILKTLHKADLDSTLLRSYYYAQERFYYVSSEFNHDNYYTPLYKQQEHAYQDSVRMTYPYGSLEYNKYTANLLVNDQKYVAAKELLLQTIPTIKKPSRFASMVYYDLAEIYKILENNDAYAHYLTLAAIADRKVPTKENAAIKDLAFYLYKNHPNELDRANKYIQVALEDARFFNNRQRILQISEKLPVIVNAFQEMRSQENHKLKNALILISVLMFLILLSLLFLYRKIKQLRKARTHAKKLNAQLQHTNAAIIEVNNKLSQANDTREAYLGTFMDLCATYISKLDDYKELVKHKIINNKTHEILKNMHSPQFMASDRNDFFTSFDKAVLHLFPNFITDVNKLLDPKNQLAPKNGVLLNTELRILALIRLGVDSSHKIASFLHYSPQTIYNYRVKLRSYSKGDRENFEESIKQITT